MDNNRVVIIAEAGVNHNGDIETAKQLIDAAAEAGADYVKFQTFKADKLVSASAKKAHYQQSSQPNVKDESQATMLKKLELSEEDHHVLIEHCNHKGIRFLSTAFDEESLDFLQTLGITLFKVPSGELTNLPYLRKITSIAESIILSTGMASMNEIHEAVDVVIKGGKAKEQITILHCNTEYPTPMADVNLRAMQAIAKSFGVKVGYSDHTLGTEVPIAAVALGACIIEKHFTLSRTMPGPDHAASLEPAELKQMVQAIRNIQTALGSDLKEPTESEKKNITAARKSIHVKRNIRGGEILTESDLIMLRPGNGISPMFLDNVVGKQAVRDLGAGDQLKQDDYK
jgi:N,N'-diacetyllegionaminate synthase